jgi:hypothetical protein
MSISDTLAAFLAFGLLHLRGVSGKAGWRWLFLIEALLTLVVGLAGFVLMPPSPTQTASKLRGKKGWFTEREETIIINRVIREDPAKSGMHNRQPITPKLLWKSMCDFDLWPLYIIGLLFQIPETTPTQYLTLTLKGLGFGTFKTNLLVIPSTVLHMITMLLLTYTAEILGELTLVSAFGQIWALPFLVYIYKVDITKISKWKAFSVMSLLLSYPSGKPTILHIYPSFANLRSTSHTSGLELPQLQRSSFSNCFGRVVQYVRPSRRNHCLKRLSSG